jgi:hypothetical protein
MQALVGLVGAIVGGLLVILGDSFSQRSQIRRETLRLAWENAAEIIANKRTAAYLCTKAHNADMVKLGDADADLLSATDRVQDTRFYMLPVSEGLRESLRAINDSTNALENSIAGDSAQFRAALRQQRQAIFDFEALMRVHLGAAKSDRRIAHE